MVVHADPGTEEEAQHLLGTAEADGLQLESGGFSSESEDEMFLEAGSGTLDLLNETMLDPVEFQIMQQRFEQASVYLYAGQNNIKFDMPIDTPERLTRYKRVHNHPLYLVELAASTLLLSLAAIEAPSVNLPYAVMPIWIHIPLELVCLAIFSIESALHLKWLGRKRFLRQGRCVIKVVLIVLLAVESTVILSRGLLHFRVTRALRPFFLLDNHYMASVRRVTRQIMQSVWPILDMIILLMFFICMFTVIGFYAFSKNNFDPFFATLKDSFVSLFVLITTANYPDVMMPSYSTSGWAFFFFFFYLMGGLYFLQNLLLAVVYDTFRNKERGKFRSLFLHKREAIRRTYALLKDDLYGGIPFSNFRGMMAYRQPRSSPLRVRLMFNDLNASETGAINLQEFYHVYSTEMLKWERVRPPSRGRRFSKRPWLRRLQIAAGAVHKFCSRVVASRFFEIFIDVVIIANTILITYDAAVVTEEDADEGKYVHHASADIAFLSIYWAEVFIKVVALGVFGYFEDGWHRFDGAVTVMGTVMIVLNLHASEFIALRQLRVLRLFKIKRRFRQVLGSMFVLIPKLVSFLVALLTVFYAFAIVGIEVFADTVKPGCEGCGDYYSNSTTTNRYYLNNFDNIFSSFVTLFVLMVVNNWFVIMNGFVAVTNEWARVYFMLFYICAVILTLNVVVAFILETFLSRMSFERMSTVEDAAAKDAQDDTVNTEVLMSQSLYHQYRKKAKRRRPGELGVLSPAPENSEDAPMVWERFRGFRKKMIEDYQVLLFHDEVAEWCLEDSVYTTSMQPVAPRATAPKGADAAAVTDEAAASAEFFGNQNRDALTDESLVRSLGLDDMALEEFRLQLPPGAAERLPWALRSQATRIQNSQEHSSMRRRRDRGEEPRPLTAKPRGQPDNDPGRLPSGRSARARTLPSDMSPLVMRRVLAVQGDTTRRRQDRGESMPPRGPQRVDDAIAIAERLSTTDRDSLLAHLLQQQQQQQQQQQCSTPVHTVADQ